MPTEASPLVIRLTTAALRYEERIAFRDALGGRYVLATFGGLTVALTADDAERVALAAEGDGAWEDIPEADRDPDCLPLAALRQMIRDSAVSDADELTGVAEAAGRPLGIPTAPGYTEWHHPCWRALRDLTVADVQVTEPSGLTYVKPGEPTADKPITSVSIDCHVGLTVDIWHTVAGKAAVIGIMARHGYAPSYEYARDDRADGLICTVWCWIG